MLRGGQGEGMGGVNAAYREKYYLKRQHRASKLHAEAVGAKRRFEELRRQIWMSTKNPLAGTAELICDWS